MSHHQIPGPHQRQNNQQKIQHPKAHMRQSINVAQRVRARHQVVADTRVNPIVRFIRNLPPALKYTIGFALVALAVYGMYETSGQGGAVQQRRLPTPERTHRPSPQHSLQNTAGFIKRLHKQSDSKTAGHTSLSFFPEAAKKLCESAPAKPGCAEVVQGHSQDKLKKVGDPHKACLEQKIHIIGTEHGTKSERESMQEAILRAEKGEIVMGMEFDKQADVDSFAETLMGRAVDTTHIKPVDHELPKLYDLFGHGTHSSRSSAGQDELRHGLFPLQMSLIDQMRTPGTIPNQILESHRGTPSILGITIGAHLSKISDVIFNSKYEGMAIASSPIMSERALWNDVFTVCLVLTQQNMKNKNYPFAAASHLSTSRGEKGIDAFIKDVTVGMRGRGIAENVATIRGEADPKKDVVIFLGAAHVVDAEARIAVANNNG